MYPELITRSDLKVFLPPIGGLTAYIIGNPQFLSDPTKRLTARVHDECNGSDVFGSDICTCRPYLIYGIEEVSHFYVLFLVLTRSKVCSRGAEWRRRVDRLL
jgi:GTP cyclohydrolase II